MAPARPQAPPRSFLLLKGLWSPLLLRPGAPRAASSSRVALATRNPEELRGAGPGAQGCGGTTEVLQAGILGEASSVALAAPAAGAAGPQRPLDPTPGYGTRTAAAAGARATGNATQRGLGEAGTARSKHRPRPPARPRRHLPGGGSP